jgi:uncharacterized membrane protein (DUF2068 family)
MSSAEDTGDPIRKEKRPQLSGGFVAVIVFKCLKAAAFILVGIVVLRIARLPSHSEPMELARLLQIRAERESVQRLSAFLSQVTPGQVEALGTASILIGLVFAAEGTFLALRIWWATYFTIFLTALGIPIEVREILKSPGSPRLYVLLAINVAILVYVWRRRNEFRSGREH